MTDRARERYFPQAKAGGVVVVTLFHCHTIAKMLLIWRLHRRLKQRVRRKAKDFLGVYLILDWRARTVRSISLWASLHGIYDMGEVPEHVAAVRVPGSQGIQTLCGIFSYEGDWLKVLFDARVARPSPLDDWVSPSVIRSTNTGGSRSTPVGRPDALD
jgi:hypothetical protein